MADVAAQAQRLPAGEALSFSFRIPGIVPLLAVGLVVRLALAFIDGFGVDMGTFQAWSNDLAVNGPWNFYQDDKFTDYAPGYMYVLWFFGEINQMFKLSNDQFEYMLKIPSIIADLGSAILLYMMLKDKRPELRLAVAAIYIFFPAALFIGALWGQVDSLLAFFLLLSVYYLSKGRPVAGAVAFAVGFLMKPQAIAALPFLAFWIIRQYPPMPRDDARDKWLGVVVGVGIAAIFAMRLLAGAPEQTAESNPPSATEDFFGSIWSVLIPVVLTGSAVLYLMWNDAPGGPRLRMPPRVWFACAVVPLAVVLVLITPFFKLEPWNLFDVLEKATNVPNYRVNSFWAYNFWNTGGIFTMGFRCDIDSACAPGTTASDFLGIDTRYWSVVLFTSAVAAVLVVFRNARGTGFLALGTTLCVLAFYLLLTRMHERYMFAAFLPFLLACALIQSRALWALFAGMSVVHFLNLYHVFAYYQLYSTEEGPKYPDFLRVDKLHDWLASHNSLAVSLPLLGKLETVQVMSGLLVIGFVVLLGVSSSLANRRSGTAVPS